MAPGPCLDNSRYTYITHIIICVINLRVMWPPTHGRRWRPHSRTLPRGRPIFFGHLMAASPCRWLGSSYRQEWRAYYDCHRSAFSFSGWSISLWNCYPGPLVIHYQRLTKWVLCHLPPVEHTCLTSIMVGFPTLVSVIRAQNGHLDQEQAHFEQREFLSSVFFLGPKKRRVMCRAQRWRVLRRKWIYVMSPGVLLVSNLCSDIFLENVIYSKYPLDLCLLCMLFI